MISQHVDKNPYLKPYIPHQCLPIESTDISQSKEIISLVFQLQYHVSLRYFVVASSGSNVINIKIPRKPRETATCHFQTVPGERAFSAEQIGADPIAHGRRWNSRRIHVSRLSNAVVETGDLCILQLALQRLAGPPVFFLCPVYYLCQMS